MGKKKMSKEERKKYEAEKAEALRVEMEKDRQRQLEEDRNQKMKQLSDARERHKREIRENKMRRVQLAESCAFFKKITMEIEKIHAEQRKLQEWKRYMRCNGLPNAHDPGDLRTYIHMWQLECDRYNENEQNWLLRTDERTILTQNRNIKNETRVHLQQQQPTLGDLYAKRTHDVLGILEEIDEGIESQTMLKSTIIEELKRLKLEFRLKLTDYIDDFSFKILSNIDRDMKLEGLLIATHFYECDVFKSHLWTKRDIPQPLLNEKERQKEAKSFISIEFPSIRLHLALPPSVKCKNGAIRAMWLSYDHFSDFCPSFRMPGNTAINFDLSEAAKKEWRKRKELEEMARTEGERKPSTSQGGGGGGGDGAVPFDSFELLNIPIVDVDKLYMDYIMDVMKKNRASKGKDALNLKDFELNLRHYRIIGGIYCLDYFEQPEQSIKLTSKSYLRTIGNSKNLKRRQFFQYFRTPDPTPAGVRRLPEEVEAELKMVERGLSKLSYVTITLPEDIMWFEPPTVCRWETVDETEVSEQIENKPTNGQLTKQRSVKMVSKKVERSHVSIVDFNLLKIPSKIDINFIIQDIIVPRLPDGYTIALSEPKCRPSSTAVFSVESEHSVETKPTQIQSINDILIATNSPRPLHPKRAHKVDVTILDRKVGASQSNEREYLFSQLLRDLDDLCDKQEPLIQKKMDDISDILSGSMEDDGSQSEAELNADDGLLKPEEFTWNIGRRETVPEIIEPVEEDSDDELDESDHEETQVEQPKEPVIGRWSRRDIHDPKFNEEKLAIQFRAGRLGSFGLAVNWFANLPFQTWECKPDNKKPGHIFYSLTASVVSIDITITEDGIILNSFQGGTAPPIQDAIGTSMTFQELKRLLYKAGINLFPDSDAFSYSESLCEKDTIMEFHLYDCMAHLGLTHNFMWSRWNAQLNSRSMALLVREIIEKRKTPLFSTLFVTPLKAYLVESTEVSTSFSATALDVNQSFFADLYHLSREISQPASMEKQMSMSPLLRNNMLQILKSTRPLSLS